MSTTARCYAFHELPVRDKLLLKSMVERGSRRLGQCWTPGDLTTASCVFYRGEPPQNLPKEVALVHVGPLADVRTTHTLKYPLRVNDVAAMLAAIELRPTPAEESASAAIGSWHALVARIQALLAQGRRAALVDANGCGWVMEVGERQYTACGPSELAPRVLLETPPAHWRLVDAPAAIAQPRRPLETLLWFLGIAAGAEGVISSIDSERRLRMRVWPYLLARSPRRFSEFANQLRQGERSAKELQAAADASLGEVAAFVNACSLCGFLAPADEPRQARTQPRVSSVDTAPAPAQRFTRFLGAIRHALGMPA